MAGTVRKALSGDGFAVAFSATVAACALALALPQPGFAGIAEDINAWLCGILRDTCNWIFAGQTDMLRSIGVDGVLAADFEQMLGGAGDVTMYDLVRGVWQAAILPIGCGMLSFVFTVQLIKVSQRMDGNASMPGVKEVVFMLVFFAVFLFLIQNSFDLMQAVYQVVQLAIDLGGLNAASAGAPVVDSIVGGLSYALQYLAMCVLLILSLVKSGSWARDVLGG